MAGLDMWTASTHRSRDEDLTQLELAWELDGAGVKVPLIVEQAGKLRATVYR
jgi:hypothetical protein